MMRALIFLLVALFLGLQYKLWFAPGNIRELMAFNERLDQLEEKNAIWREQNAVLEQDILELKKGNEAVEERARSELGMIKKGEVFYQVIDDKKQKK